MRTGCVLAPHAPQLPVSETFGSLKIRRFRYFFSAYEKLAYEGGMLAKLKKNIFYFALIPFFLLGEWWAVWRFLRKTPVDVIHAHWIFPQAFIALTATMFSRTRPAILCTSHGGDLYGLRGHFWQILKTWVVNRIDAMTVVSNAMREELTKLPVKSEIISVVPMGVDLKKHFTPPNEQVENASPIILFAGRLVEKKGLTYLLDAFAIVLKDFPEAVLKIIGNGPLYKTLETQTKQLGISGQVCFSGSVSNRNLPAYYRKADVTVFPSVIDKNGDQEGFGLVLVEALGCECATVTTDLRAMRDIVCDGESTLVVAQKDSAALAEAIGTLLRDKKLRRQLGQRGRLSVLSRYDWDVITQRYNDIFAGLK